MDATGTDVLHVLEDSLGLEGQLRGDEYWVSCPHPDHTDQKPSFSINTITGYCSCFSCGFKSDLPGLASVVLGVDYRTALQQLESGGRETILALLQRRLAPQQVGSKRIPIPGPYLNGPYEYMFRRGFTEDTLMRWGVRYCPSETLKGNNGTFTVHDCIALPAFNERGQRQGWIYRSTDRSHTWQPRYLYFPGMAIGDFWYGSHLVPAGQDVVVVEGPLDALWVDQHGHNAIACMGSNPTERKLRKLHRYRSVTVLADRDAAGARFLDKVAKGLDGITVLAARYGLKSGATDPCEMTALELDRALGRAIPYVSWKINHQMKEAATG